MLFFILVCSPFAAAQEPAAAGCATSSIERIWACEQYTWHDSTYTASSYSTTHTYPNANSQGCDSTVTLYLTIVRNSHTIETRTSCDSYRWHDSIYTASTDSAFYRIRPNSVGCDSIIHLHLTIYHADTGYTEMSVCGAWTMHDTTTIRTLTAQGCDSLVVIALNVHAHTQGDRFDTACGSYMWRDNQEYVSDAVIRYRDTNVAGCDSIVNFYLTVYPNIDTDLYDTVCGSKLWNGVRYNGSGIYKYNGTSAHQCDSIARLHLTVYNGSGMTYHLQVCDSILWHGQTYKDAGTYTYNYTNGYGCASRDYLVLNVGARPDSTFHVDACDYYNWMGTTYYNEGVYLYDYHAHGSDCIITDTLYLNIRHRSTSYDEIDACDSLVWRDGQTYRQNVNSVRYYLSNNEGCDSVVYLHLNLHHPGASGDENAMSCDSLLWHGTKLTQSGRYTFDTVSSPGCDSTVHLTLTLFRSSHTQQSVTRCDSYTWRNDSTYTASTSEPTDTLINIRGCDSVLHLNLTINYSGSHADTIDACDSYTWHGSTYTSSNDYTYHSRTTHNCDSIMTLHLHIDRSSSSVDNTAACDSLLWRNGITYTASTTTPTFHLQNVAGCDSLITLHLDLRHSSIGHFQAAECEQYVWEGDTLTESGTYTIDTLTTQGCDSIKQLLLTIYPVTHHADTATACSSFIWNGATYTQSNDYAYFGQTIHGCDSILTLHLQINHPTASFDDTVTCDSLLWRDGNTYTVSTATPTDTLTNSVGCDSVIHLRLTIRRSHVGQQRVDACVQYVWEGDTLVNSGIYTVDTLTTQGCDSTKLLALTIHNPVSVHLQQEVCDSVILSDGNTYRQSDIYSFHNFTTYGCDSTTTIQLRVNHSTTAADTHEVCDSFTWIDSITYIQSTSMPRHTLTNHMGCDSVVTLRLTVHHSATEQHHIEACDSYIWNGDTLTESGTYTIDTNTVMGCDSTMQLTLAIHHPANSHSDVVACDSLKWIDGVTYTQSADTLMHILATRYGCDSVVSISLTVLYSTSTAFTDSVRYDSVYIWSRTNDSIYSPGTYLYPYFSAEGCPSTDTLYLLRDHWKPRFRVVGESHDTVMGYVIVYPDTLLSEGETAYFIAVPHEGYQFLHWADGSEDPILKRVMGTEEIHAKAFFLRSLGISGPNGSCLTVYPNPSDGHIQLSVTGAQLREVEVFDLTGREVYNSSKFQVASSKLQVPSSKFQVDLSKLPAGNYLLRATTDRGPILTRIIIATK